MGERDVTRPWRRPQVSFASWCGLESRFFSLPPLVLAVASAPASSVHGCVGPRREGCGWWRIWPPADSTRLSSTVYSCNLSLQVFSIKSRARFGKACACSQGSLIRLRMRAGDQWNVSSGAAGAADAADYTGQLKGATPGLRW